MNIFLTIPVIAFISSIVLYSQAKKAYNKQLKKNKL